MQRIAESIQSAAALLTVEYSPLRIERFRSSETRIDVSKFPKLPCLNSLDHLTDRRVVDIVPADDNTIVIRLSFKFIRESLP